MLEKSEFGKNLLTLRKKARFSQEELAERVGVHLNTISMWENGISSPNSQKLKRLAQALNVTESDLLSGPNDGKIKITLSYDWEKFEKGEIDMNGDLFEIFLGGHGEVGIKGAGLPKSREELQELKERMCKELDKAFDYQLERGAIQIA